MSPKSLTLIALAATASAVDLSNWSPAGPGDSRGPCPGLNSLANHNVIPHDGQGLTIPTLAQALNEVYAFDVELGTALGISALLTNPNPLGLHFQLSDISKHNAIEHDGSLTRADFSESGDDHTFRPDLYAQFMAAFDGLNTTTLETAAKAKVTRVNAESAIDSNFTYGGPQFVGSYLETAVYLLAFGQGNDTVPIPWMDSFFMHEKLPVDQGWTGPAATISIHSLAEHAFHIANVAGENPPDGAVINQDTVVSALLGLDNAGQAARGWIQTWLNQFGFGDLMQGN